MQFTNGTYHLQGVSFQELANQFGTPLYVYDAAKITQQIQSLKTAFAEADVKIKYAAKALTNISILKFMRQNGVGVDVVSIQEAQLALRAGYRAQEIMFTPNCVDFSEIEEAVGLGLNINLDNLPMLEKFGKKYGSTYACCLRLNPHILAGGNFKISTGHSHSKFGISVQQEAEIKRIVKAYGININGLHIHTGSEILDLEVFLKMSDILFRMAEEFVTVKFVDFGGGIKVAYKPGEAVTDLTTLGAKLGTALKNFKIKTSRPLELWMEPGKFLVSEAGYLITHTNVVKETPTVTFAGVNSGLNHLIRPMMYDAFHDIVNVSNPSGEKKQYNIVGNICETDTFGSERLLNEVREGDLIVIKNAGAYGYSMASNYNSRLRPAEVMVIDGKARLIRERDKFEQLLEGQVDIF